MSYWWPTLEVSSSGIWLLLSLPGRMPRILQAGRIPFWRLALFAYLLSATSSLMLVLQSVEGATFQDSKSPVIISCSSVSFLSVSQFHKEKINLWFGRCHHFHSFPGLTRKSLHLPTVVPGSQPGLQDCCVTHPLCRFPLRGCLTQRSCYISKVYFDFA